MFYNARWYDSSLGRFAQADSIVPGGVQGWDRYAYVNNSPINYTDPSGHMGCKPGGKCPGRYYGGNNHHLNPRDDEDGGCVTVTPTPPPPPGLLSPPILPSPYDLFSYESYPPNGYIEVPTVYFDYRKVDWLHVVSNGASIGGDAATIAAFLTPLPIVDEAYVATAATGVNAIGIAIDAYDILDKNDFSGGTIDTLEFLGSKTKALSRIAPVFGIGAHIIGLANAFKPGFVPMTKLVPLQ